MGKLSDIEIKRELRPCLVHEGKALFHTWEQFSLGEIEKVFGIVEDENGCVIKVNPISIQFLDNKIQEYSFMPAGNSPVALGKMELFGEIDGHSFYVVRDEYGRIVVSDELMRELIERVTGSSTEEVAK